MYIYWNYQIIYIFVLIAYNKITIIYKVNLHCIWESRQKRNKMLLKLNTQSFKYWLILEIEQLYFNFENFNLCNTRKFLRKKLWTIINKGHFGNWLVYVSRRINQVEAYSIVRWVRVFDRSVLTGQDLFRPLLSSSCKWLYSPWHNHD